MEKHTTAFNNAHTQLLLEMQINSNIQGTKEQLLSTQTELCLTKEFLGAKQVELEATKATLASTKAMLGVKISEIQKFQAESCEAKRELQTTKSKQYSAQKKLLATKVTLASTQTELHEIKEQLIAKQVKLKTAKEMQAITLNELETTKLAIASTKNELELKKKTLSFKTISFIVVLTAIVAATQYELYTTRLGLTTKQVNHFFKMNGEAKDNHIKILQDHILNKVEKGIKLNQQIIETFASYYNVHVTPEKAFKVLIMKPTINQIEPIEPIEIEGSKLEFSKVNELVKRLHNPSYETCFKLLMTNMETGQIYHIDDNRQLIFKLQLPKNKQLYITHSKDISSFQRIYLNKVVLDNDDLILFDFVENYQIYIKTTNFDEKNSKCYLYPKNANEKKLLLNNGWNKNLKLYNYKTRSDEVPFYIIKN